MSRKHRRKGNSQVPKGKFAPIPTEVLKKACNVLSGPEIRSFLAICSQSQHWNNGTAKLCRSVIKEWKLGSNTTVSLAKNKMLLHGLICQTRKAAQQRCAMYGVMYLQLNEDEMAKHGCSAPSTVALNGDSALQTVVAQQRYSVSRTNATGIVALEAKRRASATHTVASDTGNHHPALHTQYPSKSLPGAKPVSGGLKGAPGGAPVPPDDAHHASTGSASPDHGTAHIPALRLDTPVAPGSASDVQWQHHRLLS